MVVTKKNILMIVQNINIQIIDVLLRSAPMGAPRIMWIISLIIIIFPYSENNLEHQSTF